MADKKKLDDNPANARPQATVQPEQEPVSQREADRQADKMGADQVQQRVDQENEVGYVGIKVDPTPNENYTVEGVTAGKPTPETDPKLAGEARAAAGLTR